MPETMSGGCHSGRVRFCVTADLSRITDCNCSIYYVPRSDRDKIDINVRCLDGIDVAALTVHRFDGQHWEHAITERVPWR